MVRNSLESVLLLSTEVLMPHDCNCELLPDIGHRHAAKGIGQVDRFQAIKEVLLLIAASCTRTYVCLRIIMGQSNKKIMNSNGD